MPLLQSRPLPRPLLHMAWPLLRMAGPLLRMAGPLLQSVARPLLWPLLLRMAWCC